MAVLSLMAGGTNWPLGTLRTSAVTAAPFMGTSLMAFRNWIASSVSAALRMTAARLARRMAVAADDSALAMAAGAVASAFSLAAFETNFKASALGKENER